MMFPASASGPKRGRVWLSRGVSELFDRPAFAPSPYFDVLIVGSGYGGAITAAMLAGCRFDPGHGQPSRNAHIGLLERGDEFLPGAFPSKLSELPGHVRFCLPGATSASGIRWGLFDVRVGADIVTVMANGLGGGSLINAGVMLQPLNAVLAEAAWPSAIRNDPAALGPFFNCARDWLGAAKANTVAPAGMAFPKLGVMTELGGAAVPITVALGPESTSSAGVPMNPCIGCGDCATGCNHGAKESLDVNLLVHARRAGVEIYTGATVLRLEQRNTGGWWVVLNHTDPALRRRQKEPLRIAADKVVLAAGTFGSTEILMRSRKRGLRMSTKLGKRFSANGDLFAAAYDTEREVNAVADETVPPAKRNVGPTITAAIDRRHGHPDTDLSIQELAVPASLRRAFEEIFTTAHTLQTLGEHDGATHAAGDPDRNAVDPIAVRRTIPLALISRDAANGELELAGDPGQGAHDTEGDGALHVRWPGLARDPRFDTHHEHVERLLGHSGVGGRLLPNPVWKILKDREAEIIGLDRGPLLTVHPLGGCTMADDAESGVVNELGQVFKPDRLKPTAVYRNLVVLDGSIVPTSLGINPALTIAALAVRGVEGLRKRWGFSGGFAVGASLRAAPSAEWRQRPVFRQVPAHTNGSTALEAPQPTEVQLIERLRGSARLADGDTHHLELTLHSHPVALGDLMSRMGLRRFDYDPRRSALRVFKHAPSAFTEDQRRSLEASAPVSGSLDLFKLIATRPRARTVRALIAWLLHRGMRDIVQELTERSARGQRPEGPVKRKGPGLRERVRGVWGLASRAGAERMLEYNLRLGDVRLTAPGSPARLFGEAAATQGASVALHGWKRFTYDGRLSPWQQLMDLKLDFSGLSSGPAELTLDLPYLASQGVPLLRVVRQQDHVQALVDLASFHLYVLRMVLDTHMWSFRRPDRVPPRVVNRFPGATRDLPHPDRTWREVTRIGDKPVCLLLSRYRPRRDRGLPPVILIHGYSASGTTFVHPTLRPGLAGRLVREGRDVWVLDLRSSAAMDWARYPWTFEQIACEDIPLAVDHVVGLCGGKVDVVAHCMGAAMLCMALLGDISKDPKDGEPYARLRNDMRERVRRIVLSQVGPVLMMSPTNQARAFVMRYVRQLMPMGEYEFRPYGDGSSADVLLDRLLATLPYPADEYRRENPLWPPGATTPWVRTRRRMDALYGQVFKLNNLSRPTLEHLDDFFGPMNVNSVSQVIHFTRSRAITDTHGRHVFATPDRLRILRRYPILSIHGEENGLVDVSTATLLERALDSPLHQVARLPGFGHQDCLIGRDTRCVFDKIVAFLGNPSP